MGAFFEILVLAVAAVAMVLGGVFEEVTIYGKKASDEQVQVEEVVFEDCVPDSQAERGPCPDEGRNPVVKDDGMLFPVESVEN